MEQKESLAFVRNDRIEFVTTRSPSSDFAVLGRQIVVTGPPELVELVGTGDKKILHELVQLLKDRDRAWAAVVLLAALTHREEKMVDTFSASPEKWWESVGKTAFDRWSQWITESQENLVWDAQSRAFVERR